MNADVLASHPGDAPRTPVASGQLLEVSNLSVTFKRKGRRDVRAVDGVSFSVAATETLGIVGESGSGKSVTALAVLGLLPKRGVEVTGSIKLAGVELLGMNENTLRDLRGREMAMVFQDPMTSLNPVITVGEQVTEVLRRHREMDAKAARAEAADLLLRVGIPDGNRRLKEYPHQLSGGMGQRVADRDRARLSARALDRRRADHGALDVTIQAPDPRPVDGCVSRAGHGRDDVTHDLGVVAGLADRVRGDVLRRDRRVSATARPLCARPGTATPAGCFASHPAVDGRPPDSRLVPIPGLSGPQRRLGSGLRGSLRPVHASSPSRVHARRT